MDKPKKSIMDVKKLIESLHPLERKVLPYLKKYKSLKEIAKASGMQEIEVMRALQWLSNKNLVKLQSVTKENIQLDKNGQLYVKRGLPEKRFLNIIKDKILNLNEIRKQTGLSQEEIGVCLGILKKKAAITFSDGKVKITNQGLSLLGKESLEEKFLKKLSKGEINLNKLTAEEKFAYEIFLRRKEMIKRIKSKLKEVGITPSGNKIIKVKIKRMDVIDRLTPEMIRKGTWKGKPYRRYDIKINVPNIYGGKRHFVNQSIEYIKKIWLELGFKEMKGDCVQTAFWDLDSLFVPQDHPARQMQDTFYIGSKKIQHGSLPELYKKIKEVHENGGNTGSKGWQCKWDKKESSKLLLRTHNTVLSAQTIAKLKEKDLPAKFFSVGKVFRNEALDWKHLFEFYQVEGIVVDPNANLKHLKGYLREFFGKMGYPDVRMRPAHFPYTEPSMEVDVWHPIKKEWVELGGAGIFRPEVVKPLLGKDIPVLAWGLGMPRIISGYYGITDIRDLYRNDLKQIREMKSWMK